MARLRMENVAYYHSSKQYSSLQQLRNPGEMHGARRVITFCLLTAVLPTILLIIPLYLRHSVFADVIYAVAESDVLEAVDGISTIFCQEQTLKMNTTFTAFQLKGIPKLSSHRKHILLNKRLVLPDDTLEYWGFYLLKGSTIILSACSRFEGSRVLAVIGEKNLRTCGLKEHEKSPSIPPHLPGQAHTYPPPRKSQDVPKEHTPKNVPTLPSVNTQPMINQIQVQTQKPLQQSVQNKVEKNNNREEQFEGEDDDSVEDDDTGEDYSKEETDRDIKSLEQKADSIIIKRLLQNTTQGEKTNGPRRVRHAKRRLQDMEHEETVNKHSVERNQRIKLLQDSLNGNNHLTENRKSELREINGNQHRNEDVGDVQGHTRQRRDVAVFPGHMLDGGIGHGGNAANFSNIPEVESSESSFEINLRSCYEGQELFQEIIAPSHLCTDTQIESHNHTMYKSYDVESDGYYYYIFYSDNDMYQNTIHARFNIYKPTYQHTNYSRGCINQTECSFSISFMSDEIVIVEVPTRDGIEHEDADMSYLISSCYPRMSIYIIFPIAVLFLVLGCAFL